MELKKNKNKKKRKPDKALTTLYCISNAIARASKQILEDKANTAKRTTWNYSKLPLPLYADVCTDDSSNGWLIVMAQAYRKEDYVELR